MAQISCITLPNGDTYNLKGSPYFVVAELTYDNAGDTSLDNFWSINLPNVINLYEGLTIAALVPADSRTSTPTSESIQITTSYKNNLSTDPLPCKTSLNEFLTIDKVKKGSIIFLVYSESEEWISTTSKYSFSTSNVNVGISTSNVVLGSTNLVATSRTNDYKLDLSSVLTGVTLQTEQISIPNL